MPRQLQKMNTQPQVNKIVRKGPTAFEVVYLAQLKEELEIFLKGRGFDTINRIALSVRGDDYNALMTISK
ncbi:MAG: hypothetical protein AB7F59_13345 [Bdellovibrionales bacterium]